MVEQSWRSAFDVPSFPLLPVGSWGPGTPGTREWCRAQAIYDPGSRKSPDRRSPPSRTAWRCLPPATSVTFHPLWQACCRS